GIKNKTGYRNGRHPLIQRLLHTVLLCALTNLAATVVFAVSDHWPTIILARLSQIYLIAALRTMLCRPKLAGFGMQSSALDIAMADGPNFRQRAGSIYIGVILRCTAVGIYPHNLALVVVQGLRILHG